MKDIIARVRGFMYILKCRLMKKNIIIGTGLKMYCKLDIKGEGMVSIGKNCTVSRIYGDDCHYVTIYTHNPKAVISIGNNAMLFAARISSKFEINIGDDILMEESGITDTDFHSINIDRSEPLESNEKCRVRIGNRVSIGARSVVCKGVKVGNNVVIWPGSIVSRNIPSGIAVCGNPAKPIREEVQ